MTAFVLVSGPFTGGEVWQAVAERLRAAGAEAHPVTLDRDPGSDLETHVQDVLRAVDSVAAAGDLVLVGHDYGIHPVLGAADRRVDRIARIVYLDAGLPQDGDLPLALVPDPDVHRRLAGADEADLTPVPVPEPEEWQRWGSTAGLTAAQLERLSRASLPQPRRTLTRPLRLSGAVDAIPTSGVLCTTGGLLTVDAVQELVRVGPPHLRRLADPRVGFLELPTGHWPMLSGPEELAEALLRAAAGGGRRLTLPDDAPGYLCPFPLQVPEAPRVRRGRLDLHLPQSGGEPRPAVLFVHGGPVPADRVPTPRDVPFYQGYARLAAAQGVVGAVVDHGLHTLADYGRAALDVAEAVAVLRAEPQVDPDRIALWFFSAGGLLSTDGIAEHPDWLRCVALSYPVLAPLPGWFAVDPRLRPAAAIAAAGADAPPLVLVRAGREAPQVAETVAAFLAAAEQAKAAVEIVDAPNGGHAFDMTESTDEVRAVVGEAMRAVLVRLQG
ncbi:alpha/beta fold hydrolase [Streptacidiphilus monticola]|uniref:Alpha/beta fold hydrolase n=1 Tax=Streptacidiphilus monticola TaxID=2161674 RepID=A0ABW1G3H2_9ACTN